MSSYDNRKIMGEVEDHRVTGPRRIDGPQARWQAKIFRILSWTQLIASYFADLAIPTVIFEQRNSDNIDLFDRLCFTAHD
jgi:hypothetical protein